MLNRRLARPHPRKPALRASCALLLAGLFFFAAGAAAQAPQEVHHEEAAASHTAADSYLQTIAEAGKKPLSATLRQHLLHTVIVMSEDARRKAGVADDLDHLPEDAGARLVAWWQKQDPLPNTIINERLEEHLSRVAFALKRYGSKTDARGFDDRGEIFVRLGPPASRHSIRLPESMRAFDFTNVARVPEVPENEIWLYGHLSKDAYYLFIGDAGKGAYREAQPHELIRSRQGVGRWTNRTRNRTEAVLLVMEEVYGQLALTHPSFGPTYDRITTYRVSQTMPGLQRPDTFVRTVLAEAAVSEVETTGRRDVEVPRSYSTPLLHSEIFPAEVRAARFLNEDATTRLELAWGVQIEALAPSDELVRRLRQEGHEPSDRYLVAFSAAPSVSGADRRLETKYYLLNGASTGRLPAPTYEIEDVGGVDQLSLQWEQFWANGSDRNEPTRGARLRVGSQSVDLVGPLESSGAGLEMSDLKPVLHNRPYPFAELSRAAPIALYFELYNLHFGADDRTHYTIEYEVARRGGRSDAQTRARTEYDGDSRTAQEYIELDLRDWEGYGELEISVRAVDNVTAEEIARSIEFTLRP